MCALLLNIIFKINSVIQSFVYCLFGMHTHGHTLWLEFQAHVVAPTGS